MSKNTNRLVTLIVGGWGTAPSGIGNLISENSKELSSLGMHYPVFALDSALPKESAGQTNNWNQGYSEIATGQGIVSAQDKLLAALENAELYQHPFWLEIAKKLKKSGGKLQVLLLWDDSYEIKHILHNLSLLASRKKLPIILHLIPLVTTGLNQAIIEAQNQQLAVGSVASIEHLDQTQDWATVEKYYNLLTNGSAEVSTSSLADVLAELSAGKLFCFGDPSGVPVGNITDQDAVLAVNLRSIFFVEIMQALSKKEFSFFERRNRVFDALYFSLLPLAGLAGEKYFYTFDKQPKTVAKILLDNDLSVSYYAQADRPQRLLLLGRGDFLPSDQESFSFIYFKAADLSYSIEEQAQAVVKGVASDIKKETDAIFIDFSWLDKAIGRPLEEVARLVEITDRFIGALSKEVLAAGRHLLIVSHAPMLESYLDPKTDALSSVFSARPVLATLISPDYVGKNIYAQAFEGDWGQLAPVGSLAQLAATQLKLCGLPEQKGLDVQSLV